MTEQPSTACDHAWPRLLVTAAPIQGLRCIADVRRDIQQGFAATIWQSLLAEAHQAMAQPAYLPTSHCPGRAAHHVAVGNCDFVIVDAVCRRLKNTSLAWLITQEARYQQDALAQLQCIFDDSRWPHWVDMAHATWEADLRTGQLMRAIGYALDWLSSGLTDAQRAWIVRELDCRAIQPYLRMVEQGAWFTRTERMNNWNTVIVGGAGTAAMAMGDQHPQSQAILQHADEIMLAYLEHLGAQGEFDESVSYAGAMHCPIEYFAVHRYHTQGRENLLADDRFTRFCNWYMHFILPPGRSARFGDCPPDAPPKALNFVPIAAATRNGVFQWFYMHHAQPGPRSDWSLELLSFDPTIPPRSPEGQLPRGKAYTGHGGLWSSRTDWNPNTTACVVHGKAGHGNECHGHHDAGQICIDGHGAPLIVDLGHPAPSYPQDFFTPHRWRYYNASVIGHNILTVDGRDMQMAWNSEHARSDAHFNEHLADHWRTARVIGAQFDDHKGGYWQADLTPLHHGAINVMRTAVHLHPGIVAVLDDARWVEPESMTLRWHVANACKPDDDGRFIVVNDGVSLASCITRLDGPLQVAAGHHAYHPPFDHARGGQPLQQRHEPFIAASCHDDATRMLSLFCVFAPDSSPQLWQRENDHWQIDTPQGQVRVTVKQNTLRVENIRTQQHWQLALPAPAPSQA